MPDDSWDLRIACHRNMQHTDDVIIRIGPSLPPISRLPPKAPSTLLSNAPCANRQLIPKPPKGLNRRYTGFLHPDDLPKFIQAKLFIKKLVGGLLNINVCWGSQDPRAVERLKEEILKEFPAFAKYEAAWPVMYYAYQQLGEFRRGVDPSLKRQSQRYRPSGCLPEHASAMRAPESGCARYGVDGMEAGARAEHAATADKTDNNQRGAGACPRAPPNTTMGHGTPANDSQTPSQGEAYNRRLLVTVDLARQDDKEVFDFLCGIDGTFAYLLDRFRTAGLTSRVRLATLAQWRTADVDEFLANEVRLTPFERRAVKVALGKLVE
ncbi:hypothetical protein GY45DRAFT_1367300 [Cubamyces sp. BRFM 1775]|nr:hypothetical protein GY45DRAFT_1367300 [Cubamyces sp. BRFM 1775]